LALRSASSARAVCNAFGLSVITACSAGQVNQTSSQLRDKVGATAQLGDLTLRQVQLAYPTDGSYVPGEDAELQMTIVNSGSEDDTLVGIDGTGFGEVRVTGSASGTVTASPSGAATTTSSAQATTSGGARALDITIPAGSSIFLGQNAPTVTLASLGQELLPTQTMDLTFTFQRAGEVTMSVPVAVPASNVPQTSTFNYHVPTEADVPDNEVAGGNVESGSNG